MSPAARRAMLPLGLLAAGAFAWVGTALSQEAEQGWMRVPHPRVPIEVEVPTSIQVRVAPAYSLGPLRMRDHRRSDLLLFGVRPVETRAGLRHALEIVFLWMTPDARGVEPERLAALARDLSEPGTAERFLRAALYGESPRVTLTDRGTMTVSRHTARRVAVSWRTLAGTPHERRVEGEAVVLPVDPLAALVILGRFDESATSSEREVVFRRIASSVRIEGELPL